MLTAYANCGTPFRNSVAVGEPTSSLLASASKSTAQVSPFKAPTSDLSPLYFGDVHRAFTPILAESSRPPFLCRSFSWALLRANSCALQSDRKYAVLRLSGPGRVPTTNGTPRRSGIASSLYGICPKYKPPKPPAFFCDRCFPIRTTSEDAAVRHNFESCSPG